MAQKTAIVSVYDKTGLLDLSKGLIRNDVRILASGGTARMIREAGFPVDDVSSITKAPEMLGGRVKTLHPAVHGGILARDIDSDKTDLDEQGIDKVDFVVCNLYPFQETVAKINVTIPEAVEEIDIGGVTLLRAAAKNHQRVTILSDPHDYASFLNELDSNGTGEVSAETRQRFALKAFEQTAEYDNAIADFFRKKYAEDHAQLPLRYGVNPHQRPAQAFVPRGELPFEILSGSPGYVNLLDGLNAWQLVRELKASLDLPAAASFKHVSPAGAAVGLPLSEEEKKVYHVADLKHELTPLASAYARARGADRMSSFGDFIAVSDVVDAATAAIISKEVSDGIIAPGFEPEALEVLRAKKGGKYCVLKIDPEYNPPVLEQRVVFGITLEEKVNDAKFTKQSYKEIVSANKDLPEQAVIDLIVATIAIKYTQSNSVCYAKNGMTVGLGAGQQSRIHCTRLAGDKADNWWLRFHPKVLAFKWAKGTKRADKSNAIDLFVTNQVPASGPEYEDFKAKFAELPVPLTAAEREEWIAKNTGVACASDAFFPFSDNVFRAARSGVKYVYAPLGSVQDKAVLEAADSQNMVYVENAMRLFHH